MSSYLASFWLLLLGSNPSLVGGSNHRSWSGLGSGVIITAIARISLHGQKLMRGGFCGYGLNLLPFCFLPIPIVSAAEAKRHGDGVRRGTTVSPRLASSGEPQRLEPHNAGSPRQSMLCKSDRTSWSSDRRHLSIPDARGAPAYRQPMRSRHVTRAFS